MFYLPGTTLEFKIKEEGIIEVKHNITVLDGFKLIGLFLIGFTGLYYSLQLLNLLMHK